MSFKNYIKAVGTGIKGNRDLERNEIINATNMILKKEASDAQIGAFLVGWRTKLETNEELSACVEALKSFIKTKKVENSIELGYSFDGRVKNPFLFPLFEGILEDFYKKNTDIKKLNLVISGDLIQPAKDGIVTKDIFDTLDLKQYLFFYDRVKYCKELSDLTPLRHELGLRTAFNTVEKLLNPALSDYGVTTAFHKPYVKKYLDVFSPYYKEIVVVKASEGSPEVFKDGKYWRKQENEIIETSFSLKEFGISYDKEFDKISLDEAKNIINEPSDELLKLAKFNIALYLVFASRVENLHEAWERLN